MSMQLYTSKNCGQVARPAIPAASTSAPRQQPARRQRHVAAAAQQRDALDQARQQYAQLLPRQARATAAAATAAGIEAAGESGQSRGSWPLAVAAAATAAVAAAAAGLVMLSSPFTFDSLPDSPAFPSLTAGPQTLADTVPLRYRGLDADKDGLISRAELVPLETDLWLKWAEGAAPAVRAEVSPFDRYQDGSMSAGQALHYLGLEGSINANGCVTAGVWQVFDSDGSGGVDRREWSRALGDLGADGNAAKGLVFDRVDRLSGSGGALEGDGFRMALSQIRRAVAGGGGAEGVVFGAK